MGVCPGGCLEWSGCRGVQGVGVSGCHRGGAGLPGTSATRVCISEDLSRAVITPPESPIISGLYEHPLICCLESACLASWSHSHCSPARLQTALQKDGRDLNSARVLGEGCAAGLWDLVAPPSPLAPPHSGSAPPPRAVFWRPARSVAGPARKVGGRGAGPASLPPSLSQQS